jgi:hypothetical protein
MIFESPLISVFTFFFYNIQGEKLQRFVGFTL